MVNTPAPLSVHDIAQYMLLVWGAKYSLSGAAPGISTMKLHKLCYLADQFHQSGSGLPLFSEYFKHTENGPHYTDLLPYHKGEYTVTVWPVGDYRKLSAIQKELVEFILSSSLGALSGPQLRDMIINSPEYRMTDTSRFPA